MRLLVATGLYPPDIGGPATHTVFLERHADALGLSLTVVPFSRVRHLPRVLRHLVYLFTVLRHARHVDRLYALDTISVGLPAYLASILTRKPLLLRVPGDYAWEQGQIRFGLTGTLDEYRARTSRRPLMVRLLAFFQGIVARHAERVVVPSEYMRDVVTEWGVRRDRIVTIYSVLKTFNGNSARRDDDTERKELRVVTAGRLVPWKGFGAVIEAIRELRVMGIPVSLTVIGDGVLRELLKTRAQELGIDDQVHFRGALSRDALAAEIANSDVFVLNTAYEGFSHQLLEVMSLGVPVVTTPVGGNRELVTNEVTGLLVPVNDVHEIARTLQRFVVEPTLARTLTERAQASLGRFEEPVIVDAFRTFFGSLR